MNQKKAEEYGTLWVMKEWLIAFGLPGAAFGLAISVNTFPLVVNTFPLVMVAAALAGLIGAPLLVCLWSAISYLIGHHLLHLKDW